MKSKTSSVYTSWSVILKQTPERGALLIGDISSTKDRAIYTLYKVKTVIACGKQVSETNLKDLKVVEYPLVDNQKCNISQYFEQCYQKIKTALGQGGVIVSCFSGVSRSPAIVAAYLMRSRLSDYDSAIKFIKLKRLFAAPNDGFVRQLRGYQKHINQLKELQRRPSIIEEKPERKLKQMARGAARSIVNTNRSRQLENQSGELERSARSQQKAKSVPKYTPQQIKSIYQPSQQK